MCHYFFYFPLFNLTICKDTLFLEVIRKFSFLHLIQYNFQTDAAIDG